MEQLVTDIPGIIEKLGILFANLLEDFPLNEYIHSPNILDYERQDPSFSPTKNGLYLLKAVNHVPGYAQPGKYQPAICTPGESPSIGVGPFQYPDPGFGPGTIRESYHGQGGLQITGGRSIHGQCGSHFCTGSIPPVPKLGRLEPVTRALLAYLHPDHRPGWLLRSQPVQRSTPFRSERDHVPGRTASNKGRLHGAKLNKAQRGELRFPIPVGYIYDDQGCITFDNDAQVCHTIQLVFSVFKEKQTAYALVQHFATNKILFPKRAYGGRWKGKLLWGRLTHERALTILKHPFYAGVYTFGRYKTVKKINPQGEIVSTQQCQPIDHCPVMIRDHHPQYISFDEYLHNKEQLQANNTKTPDHILAGPPREGTTLLQGLLICGTCGRRMTIRYVNNKKIVPTYECNWRKRQGLTGCSCSSFRADIVDPVIEQKVIHALSPANVSIALSALSQIEKRNAQLARHREMNIQRCRYNADIAQRRFELVDPANRLVAASLEKAWNQELEKLALAESEYRQFLNKKEAEFSAHKKTQITDLAKQIPTLWYKTTDMKDKKRIVSLLIGDITVNKSSQTKILLLNIRWLTGHTEQIQVNLPANAFDKIRYPQEMVDMVRELTLQYGDDKRTLDILNRQGTISATGKPFTRDMIQWIRFKHKIKIPTLRADHEWTIKEVCSMFNISGYMAYYWIENNYVQARKTPANAFLVKITPDEKVRLLDRIENSCKAKYMIRPDSRKKLRTHDHTKCQRT